MIDVKYPEGATPIDPDETEGLLLTHITTQGELNRWEQDNIVEAFAWIEKTKPKNIFNEQFIKQLHKRMFDNVWKWAGKFRRSDKNIGVSWHQVPMCLQNMCDDVPIWIQTQNESPEEMAVRFHHRLVWIHPFPNGNGRHARLMANIFLENVLHGSPFTWGTRDLSSPSELRRRYLKALQEAATYFMAVKTMMPASIHLMALAGTNF
ncbi:MAG: mobile mystery protein B [Desulfobacterales bacterium]|nr:mobile mystery protein B [Desulfobacterales bacterium]